ncbi:MAG: hypothetical protein NVSMB21_07790 [Vulcanimicrobiaceae bacterium]
MDNARLERLYNPDDRYRNEGLGANIIGWEPDENPYVIGTREYREWAAGFGRLADDRVDP